MSPEQIFQLKITALQLAQGDLTAAQANYTWLTEEQVAIEQKLAEQKLMSLAMVQAQAKAVE